MRDLMQKFGWSVPYIPMNVNNAGAKMDALFADDNYIAELKRDGSRYTSIEGRFFSRKKSENKKSPETLGLPVEKTANIPHLHAFFAMFPGTVVEGEIYYPGGKSNTVTGIMGCDPWKALMRQGFGEFNSPTQQFGDPDLLWRLDASEDFRKVHKVDKDFHKFKERGKIHYMLFEMTYFEGEDLRGMPWSDRRERLEYFYETEIEGTAFAEYIHLTTPFEGDKGKRALLKWAEDNQEEGIVFKNVNSIYQCDKRPEHHWYRIKGKIYADVVLIGYAPPTAEYKGKELSTWRYWEFGDGTMVEFNGSSEAFAYQGTDALAVRPVTKNRFMGWIGSLKFGLYKDGELVDAGTCDGIAEEHLIIFSGEGADELIGTVIEVSAMERTDKGKFRHPQFERFRDDKNAEDCLWEVEGVE